MFFELLNKQASDKYFEVGKGSEIKDSFHIKKIETRAAPMLQIKKIWKTGINVIQKHHYSMVQSYLGKK